MLAAAVLQGFLAAALATAVPEESKPYCSVFLQDATADCLPVPATFLDFDADPAGESSDSAPFFYNLFDSMLVLQQEYFDLDYSTWPSAIDWTAAVAETVVSGALTTLSESLDLLGELIPSDWKAKENLISWFYAQVVASYYGQDILSIRGEAYDDILWVALGWIEAIKFVDTHSSLYYADLQQRRHGHEQFIDAMPWHGTTWLRSFAHRARIFWNLASRGWDTSLCHGGMLWNPRLLPYKNAITNQLWISASISMYQHFPGDNFSSPWLESSTFPGRDPAHLTAAIEGYRWLMEANMTNHQGLFVDGYHIDFRKPGNVECDLRDEMVYTYNQGVVLTGQRGLWDVTGAASYLMDGHRLIQSAINATGWNLTRNGPCDEPAHVGPRYPWRGLGRGGVMEERCDASGSCSQDAQTFKGIFFHHLATFCKALEPAPSGTEPRVDAGAFQQLRVMHAQACRQYAGWVAHNANAALKTRDSRGRFGMWWTAGLLANPTSMADKGDEKDSMSPNSTDYRNGGTPEDGVWGGAERWFPGRRGSGRDRMGMGDHVRPAPGGEQVVMNPAGHGARGLLLNTTPPSPAEPAPWIGGPGDPNSRGRGRTVETQIGGVAVLRAYWEMVQAAA